MRTNIVKIRLNDDELQELDKLKGTLTRAKYMRLRALSKQGERAKNQELALALGRIGNNLNQIAKVMNTANASGSEGLSYAQCLIALNNIEAAINELWEEV